VYASAISHWCWVGLLLDLAAKEAIIFLIKIPRQNKMMKNNTLNPVKLASIAIVSSCLVLCSGNQASAFKFNFSSTCDVEYDFVAGKWNKCVVGAKGKVEITDEQLDILTLLKNIIIKPLKKFLPKLGLEGLFTSYSDTSGDFDITTFTDIEGIQSLLLTPTFPINVPGEYGNINFTYESTAFATPEDQFVGFSIIAEGTTGSEEQLSEVKCVPEPSTILSLLSLGTLGAVSTLKRKLKPSQSTEKETTKVG
jgi:hypothetical protein